MGLGATGSAILGAAGIGAVGSALSSNSAASADQSAANQQAAQAAQAQADLAPYNAAGQAYLPELSQFWGQTAAGLQNYLNQQQAAIPGQITSQNISNIPGYQQTLQQGESALQNSAASRGLGVSGAALKGATNYGTGLAQQGYQNLFNNQQQIFGDYGNLTSGASNLYQLAGSQLQNFVGLGENAAATSGNQAIQAGSNIAQSTQAAGAANAAGISGATNSLSNAANTYGGLQYLATQNALNNGSSGNIDSGSF
jgi:hypothetical protein